MPTTTAIVWKGHVDEGLPPHDNFQVRDVTVPDQLQPGEVLVELVYVSVDPYMRGRMRTPGPASYVGAFAPGAPLQGGCVAQVKETHGKAPLAVGTYVYGGLTWQQLQVATAEALTSVDTQVLVDAKLPLSAYLGTLGMTGFTAYGSLERIGKPKAGETVFVSGAAAVCRAVGGTSAYQGAVGLMVGQLCKNVYGCTVVGSAGTDEKVEELKQYGYDRAFNYKTETVGDALKRLCPNGIDVYFDNVGGETLEAALDNCNTHARVVACGAVSQYNKAPESQYGVKNLHLVITKRILIQGFIQSDFADLKPAFMRDMSQYVREGKVKHVEHVTQGGLQEADRAFIDLMEGRHFGKMVVQCGPDPFRT